MLSEMTIGEMAQIALLLSTMCFLFVAVLSFAFHYIIALRDLPDRRAAWTAGAAYFVTTLTFLFSGPSEGMQYFAPLTALPGGLIAYWWWRAEFRKAWVDDPAELPDGINLANDDWRIGAALVVGVIVIAVLKRLVITGS